MFADYKKALSDARFYLDTTDLEPTSAIREAGANNGIEWGDDMAAFVHYAWREIFGEPRYSDPNQE